MSILIVDAPQDEEEIRQAIQISERLRINRLGMGERHDLDLGATADAAEPKTMAIEQRFQLGDLQIGLIEDVGFQNRTQFDVANAARPQHVDLLLRVRRDFIGEGTENKHGIP